MNRESFVMGVAGVLLGLLGGWIIGSQQGVSRPAAPAPVQQQAAAPAGQAQPAAPALDENRVAQLKTEADRDPRNAAARAQLGNLYFDSERFDEAARWYSAALDVDPRAVEVSTDLGIAYYYTNQPDKALAQFEKSLAINPTHSKTLLNVGVVRAWGKQDLDGAARAWERVIEVAPRSEEAARAKQGLEGIRAAHPDAGRGGATKPQGPSN
ncbi:MAG: tetratricopeptide repeat protein [Acidobacteria bacterium]|nr:tetratricopeptide repeat protein [Acidobacteriota bacterium]